MTLCVFLYIGENGDIYAKTKGFFYVKSSIKNEWPHKIKL